MRATNAMPRTVEASWYDFPAFYDLAFRSETRRESDFIEAVCRKYCSFPVRRMLEPGCGSGRLIVELARRGYEMIGFDRNARSLAYLRTKLRRRRLTAEIIHASLEDFDVKELKVGAAFCTMNTFRHLLTEEAARNHLRCVTKCLQPGGMYVLGLHLLPLDVAEEDCERWTESAGSRRVTATLRVVSFDRRRRVERLRLSLRVRTAEEDVRIRSEFDFRIYTRVQLERTLAAVPELSLCGVYDFWYDIGEPLPLNEERTDTVFVLRKEK